MTAASVFRIFFIMVSFMLASTQDGKKIFIPSIIFFHNNDVTVLRIPNILHVIKHTLDRQLSTVVPFMWCILTGFICKIQLCLLKF